MTPMELLALKKWCLLTNGMVSLDEDRLFVSDNHIDGIRLTLEGLGSVGVENYSLVFDGPLSPNVKGGGK